MKLTSLICTILFCNPVSFYMPNEHPKTFLHSKKITMNPNVDIYNKDVLKTELKKSGNKWIFEPDVPLKFLVNKDDSKLIHDPRNSVFEIEFKYLMDFNNTKEDRRIKDSHYFDKNMKLTRVKSDNKDIVETGSNENLISYNNKDDRVALQVKPFMKLDINDFEEDINKNNLGHYHMKLEEINIGVSYYLFDFTEIKMKPIYVKLYYLKENWYSKVKDKIINSVVHEYGINEVIDIDKTMDDFKYDKINFLKPNRFFIELKSDDSWYTKGKINQEIIIEFDRSSLSDLKDVKEIHSSTLHKKINYLYIDESALDLNIDLDDNKITFKSNKNFSSDLSVNKFVNDGSLKNFKKYKSVEVIKDHEIVGAYKNNILNVIDAKKLIHLFDDIDEGFTKEDEQIVDETINEKNNSLDKNESEKPSNDESKNEQKNNKSNPLKYLWLLTIPFCLVMFYLITWLIPLIKRKK